MNSASTLTEGTWRFAATSCEGLWRCGLVQRAVAVLLLGGILLLALLAFASPADSGWIVGLYDEADFDDVTALAKNISALTNDDCVIDPSPDWKVSHTLLVVGIPVEHDVRSRRIFSMTCCSRAPPAGYREHFSRHFLPVTVSRCCRIRDLSAPLFFPAFVVANELAIATEARARLWAGFHLMSQAQAWPLSASDVTVDGGRPAQLVDLEMSRSDLLGPGVDARTLAAVAV